MSVLMVAQTTRPVAQRRGYRISAYGTQAWVGLLAVLVVLGWATVVQAQTWNTADITPSYDAAGNLLRQGYTFQISDQWPGDEGYRQVLFSMQANPPLADDATLTIRHQAYYYSAKPVLEVEQDFVLPAGQSNTTQFAMSVPNHQPISHSMATVWVNGILQPDLQTIFHNNSNRYPSQFQVLDVTTQRSVAFDSHRTVLPSARHLNRTYVPPDALSPHWIDYTSVDVVCIRREQLQNLIGQQPQAWQAIRRWIAAGGNLWIDELGTDRQTWRQVAQLLHLPDGGLVESMPSPQAPWQLVRVENAVDWRMGLSSSDALLLPNLAGHRVGNRRAGVFSSLMIPIQGPDGQWVLEEGAPELSPTDEVFDQVYDEGIDINNPSVKLALAELKQKRQQRYEKLTKQFHGIREGALGLGHVVLFAGPWNDAGNVFTDGEMVPDFATHWRMRFVGGGQTIRSDTSSFWDWVIPGVGQPPVLLFQVLISLFVVVIGPLNYFMLRRKRRLHLLVVTVPLSAALVTGGLVGYAALADGFDTRVRVRSFTYLDQVRGEAACWSRQTYYAGVAPPNGLRFPDDMAVYRYPPGSRENDNLHMELVWDPDQHLAAGWIQSRTMAQFLCLRSRVTTAALQIESQAGSPPRVTNRLGTHVTALLLSDDGGNTYAALNLAEDGQAVLEAGQVGEAGTAIHSAIINNQLGMDHPLAGGYTNFLEWLIGQVEEGTVGAANANVKMAPRTYVALVEQSPEVAIGCEADQVRSLHIIRGTW